MPEEFREKPKVKEYLAMFRDIRGTIKSHFNKVEDDFFFNPLELIGLSKKAEKEQEKSKNKRVLMKWGSSFGNPEELNKNFYVQTEAEQIEQIPSVAPEAKKQVTYKDLLKKLLIDHHHDFRKKLMEDCILNNPKFKDNDFEMFIFYIETFVSLFSAVQCKYFIDELGYLNMDFYATENSLMYLADLMHYKLQFRVMNKVQLIKYEPETAQSPKKHPLTTHASLVINDLSEKLLEERNQIDDELFKLNEVKYEDLDPADVSLWPPFQDFNITDAHYFRRYDDIDNFHICSFCNNLRKAQQVGHLTCSSLFRNIDKTRIIYATLSEMLDINTLKSQKDIRLCQMILVIHNYHELAGSTDYIGLLKTYARPLVNKDIKRLNNVIKNTFGEDMGFYFHWVTHYIRWLIFPAALGTFLYLIGRFMSWLDDSTAYLYFNLVFAFFVMLWANFYIASWKSLERFLQYAWGMENFHLDRANEIKDVPVDKMQFMGWTIPQINRKNFILARLFSFVITLLCLAVTIFLNLCLFYIENNQLYADVEGEAVLREVSRGYWLYIIPVCTFFVREIMSSTYRDIARKLTNREYHIQKSDFKSALLIKIILFEFFNYYFNLYYIAFIKRYTETCALNDCYAEVANQLTIILTSSIILDSTKLYYAAIYQRNKTKEFEKNLREKNQNLENKSSKYIYYTRSEYESEDASGEYLEIVMNYGYIIQFGASSPISFLIVFLQTLFMRFVDVVKVSKLLYVRIISKKFY
jgi:hypothetical protein